MDPKPCHKLYMPHKSRKGLLLLKIGFFNQFLGQKRLLAKMEHKKIPKATNHYLKLRRDAEEIGGRDHVQLVALRHSSHSQS